MICDRLELLRKIAEEANEPQALLIFPAGKEIRVYAYGLTRHDRYRIRRLAHFSKVILSRAKSLLSTETMRPWSHPFSRDERLR